MRVAWFRSQPVRDADCFDATGAVIRSLPDHQVDVITPARAHDFVWRERQHTVDLCVFELDGGDGGDAAAFMWPYLFRYPAVLALAPASLHNGRAAMLEQQ